MRIRRALLFMPGDDRRKIEKAAALSVDAVILDLEDGVALSQKATARRSAAAALSELDFGKSERLVRINPVDDDLRGAGDDDHDNDNSPLWQQDLYGTLPVQPGGYVLPKVESAAQVQRAAALITQYEQAQGWPPGEIHLLAIIESAKGIVNLNSIASSDRRLDALIFGAEDLAGSMGAMRTPDGWEVFYGRSAVVMHAAAYGLQAIDTPFVDLTVEDSQLWTETEQAYYMGYTGKLAIHPRQVPVIEAVFTPTQVQIEQAQALIAAHEAQQAQGRGVFSYDGRMVDRPMIRAAERVLARARAAGLIS